MRIGVTSQNFRSITGHAGKSRRFLIYDAHHDEPITEIGRLDLPKDMSMHAFHGEHHPIFDLDVIITAGCGEGFVERLRQHGVQVIATAEANPVVAVNAVLAGRPLPPPLAHQH